MPSIHRPMRQAEQIPSAIGRWLAWIVRSTLQVPRHLVSLLFDPSLRAIGVSQSLEQDDSAGKSTDGEQSSFDSSHEVSAARDADASIDSDLDSELDEIVVQQIMRIRDRHGRESIYATLRSDFLPQQRYASVHVAFGPAFDVVPTVEVEQIEGPTAEVRLVKCMHHGAQLELRLTELNDTATYCTVELAAYVAPGSGESPAQ